MAEDRPDRRDPRIRGLNRPGPGASPAPSSRPEPAQAPPVEQRPVEQRPVEPVPVEPVPVEPVPVEPVPVEPLPSDVPYLPSWPSAPTGSPDGRSRYVDPPTLPPGQAPAARLPGSRGPTPGATRTSPRRGSVDPEPAAGQRAAAPTPVPVRPSRGAGEVRVAVWGATSSGKSTFLLALPAAARQHGWTIDTPDNDQHSKDFLNQAKGEFAIRKLLPAATQDETRIAWELRRSSRRMGRFWPWRRRGAVITIRTIDRPGDHFREARDAAVEQLLAADGIVYLFDPEAELRSFEADGIGGVEFFTMCLTELRSRAFQAGVLREGKLPHRVAVCVTKFDASRIYNLANEGHYVTQDDKHPFLPRVSDARGFFEWVCPRLGDSARLVSEDILVNFDPDRVQYFVCSSIGFRLGRDGRFDPTSPEINNLRPNAVQGAVDRDGMHDSPRPINVLEPFVSFAQSVRPVRR